MQANMMVRAKAAAMLAGLSLLLSACFISPGKFTSELQLMGEDEFAFTYEGEIFFLGMSSLAQMQAASETFDPTCFDDETFEERECTPQEEAAERAEWDAGADERAAKAKQEAEQMSAFLGGIDPSDPEAAEELRQLLLRHKGWDRVEFKGDGVYDVSYSVSGTLSHDFTFPTIEGVPMTNPFVQFVLRDGEVVRVNAPGFAAQSDDNPLSGMAGGMAGMAGLAAMSENSPNNGEAMPNLPVIDGTFTIITDGQILANNTDEGPASNAAGQELSWDISPRTSAAPTALIEMQR